MKVQEDPQPLAGGEGALVDSFSLWERVGVRAFR